MKMIEKVIAFLEDELKEFEECATDEDTKKCRDALEAAYKLKGKEQQMEIRRCGGSPGISDCFKCTSVDAFIRYISIHRCSKGYPDSVIIEFKDGNVRRYVLV